MLEPVPIGFVGKRCMQYPISTGSKSNQKVKGLKNKYNNEFILRKQDQ